MNDRSSIDAIDGGKDTLAQLLRGGDADVSKDGAGEFGEEALDEVEPGAVFGSEYKCETSLGLLGEPSLGLLGCMGGMIVQNDLDRGGGRVGGVDLLEDLDKLARAMSFLNAGVDHAGHQIDASQQAPRSHSDVFLIAREGRMAHRRGGQVGRGGG
jgi:hypothetical protein